MRQKFKIYLSILLPLFLCISLKCFAMNPDMTLKVGLFYGSTALPNANLANDVGHGYYLGFYDQEGLFTEIGELTNEKITMMKDTNMYLGSDGLYYDVLNSSAKAIIGAFHIEVNQNFKNYGEAADYADFINAKVPSAFACYINGQYRVRIGSYATTSDAKKNIQEISKSIDKEVSVVGFSKTCITVTQTKTSNILFEFDDTSNTFGVKPRFTSSKKALTWFKGNKYYGSFNYIRQDGADITVINYVNIEDYLKGVITYEMSPNWPLEALKAQALCARSYAYTNLSKHKRYGFDVCSSVDCQVYRGSGMSNANSDRAVDETHGQFVSYKNKIATTFYHSSNGGYTEDAQNVWGSKIEYLKAVKDDFEDLANATNGIWSTTVTNSQLTSILNSKGYRIKNAKDMYVDKFTPAGNVYRLTIVDSDGKKYNFERESARTILNSSTYNVTINSMRYKINNGLEKASFIDELYINSSHIAQGDFFAVGRWGTSCVNAYNGYAITADGIEKLQKTTAQPRSQTTQNTGTYTINGTGWGHNVGMSQYGARAMAKRGYSYEDIIKFYFTDVDIISA